MATAYSNVTLPRCPGTAKKRCTIATPPMAGHTRSFDHRLASPFTRPAPAAPAPGLRLGSLKRGAQLVTPADEDLVQAHRRQINETGGIGDDVLYHWRLVKIHNATTGLTRLHVVGDSASRCRPIISSRIVAVDMDMMIVKTTSGSLYNLGVAGDDDSMPKEHAVLILQALRNWGE